MDYILSSHPISSAFKTELNSRIKGDVSYLSMTGLKSLSPFKLVKKLRSLKIGTLYLAFEENSSLSIKSTMEIIAFVSGANQIYTIQPNFHPEKVSKLGTIFQIFQFFLANLKARFVFNRSYRELKRLNQQNRVTVPEVENKQILYLKTNLWYGAKAGGSVGHVAGVINGFDKKQWSTTYASIEPPICAEQNVDFFEVPFPSQLAYPPDLNNYVYHEEIVSQLKKLAAKRNFGMIYQRMSINNFAGVILSRYLNIPLVVEYNGSEVWASKNWGRPLVYEKQAQLCEDVCLKHAHVIVTVSDVLKDELIQRGVEAEKIVSYPNCVDPEIYKPGILNEQEKKTLRSSLGFSDSDRIATFVGTFGKWHGVELLARCIRQMVDEDRSWLETTGLKFLLVGDGFLMPEVKKEVGCPPYSDFVKLTGLVPQKLAPRYLEVSDILLSPHVPNNDGSRFFGSPTKLFEYMAMGKPIIASDLEQLGEVLCDSLRTPEDFDDYTDTSTAMAVLTQAGSEMSLINGIKLLVDNPRWEKLLGKNARTEALAKYTWEDHVEKIIEKVRVIPSRQSQTIPKSWIHKVFDAQSVWAYKLTKISFFRKVIDRLSTNFLVPAIGHKEILVKSRRGLNYWLTYPEDIGYESLIVYRDYETGTSDLFEKILREGDTVYDIGANLGWYTTLAAKLVGKTGKVHAFEPVPKIYQKLLRNCQANEELETQIEVHGFAVSDVEKDFELFSYEGLPHGLTSAKALYGSHSEKLNSTRVHAKTLDQIWLSSGKPEIKMVKVDVEGVEFDVLLGAKQLIQEQGPIWLVEINYRTSEAFNWSPQQLLDFLKDNNSRYKFMRVNEAWGELKPVNEVSELRNGDVVFCYIPEKHGKHFIGNFKGDSRVETTL